MAKLSSTQNEGEVKTLDSRGDKRNSRPSGRVCPMHFPTPPPCSRRYLESGEISDAFRDPAVQFVPVPVCALSGHLVGCPQCVARLQRHSASGSGLEHQLILSMHCTQQSRDAGILYRVVTSRISHREAPALTLTGSGVQPWLCNFGRCDVSVSDLDTFGRCHGRRLATRECLCCHLTAWIKITTGGLGHLSKASKLRPFAQRARSENSCQPGKPLDEKRQREESFRFPVRVTNLGEQRRIRKVVQSWTIRNCSRARRMRPATYIGQTPEGGDV